MKFSHIADCHLGSWRQPELRDLNLKNFQEAIEKSIKERVDFVLITGDLFDSAYPTIDILEEAFFQLKKLKDASISCFYIAGSHDYSASGKTFLSVLEKAGFCQNIFSPENRGDEIILNPIIFKNIALYGYPGKKSGIEVEELKKIKLQDAPGFFKILALHTSLKKAVKNLPVEAVEEENLPKADYYALGHLHINYIDGRFVYAGPTFPDNFQELEELGHGSFYIVNTSPFEAKRIKLDTKKTLLIEIEIKNTLTATDKILSELKNKDLKEKIILLKLYGKIEVGKISDINFKKIEDFIKEKQGYTLLRNISKLVSEEPEFKIQVENMDKLEEEIIKKYCEEKKSKFNSLISSLVYALSIEKHEDETSVAFSTRLYNELKKLIKI
ncbi:MAG: metallophosphoesterase [Candidatus Pacearchaeota archaeon]